MRYEITNIISEARENAFDARRKLCDKWDRFRDFDDMHRAAIEAIDEALECLARARSAIEFMEENVK